MQTLTRAEAIKEFGSTVSNIGAAYPVALPPLDYRGQLKGMQLQNVIGQWLGNENTITVRETLGKRKSSLKARGWDQLVQREFDRVGKPSEQKVADFMKEVAAAAFNEARGEVIDLENEEYDRSNMLMRLLKSRSVKATNNMPTGEEVFDGLLTKIDYLPDNIQVPAKRLKLGDPVYLVVDEIQQGKGVNIIECEVDSLDLRPKQGAMLKPGATCTCQFIPVQHSDRFDLNYTATDKDGNHITFSLNDDGCCDSLDIKGKPALPGQLFITEGDAETKEDKIWANVERQLDSRSSQRLGVAPT